MFLNPSLRSKTLIPTIILVFLLYKALQRQRASNWSYPSLKPSSNYTGSSAFPGTVSTYKDDRLDENVGRPRRTQTDFWRKFEPLLRASSPACEPPARLGNAGSVGFGSPQARFSRPKLLSMLDGDVEKMRQAHVRFVSSIKENNAIGLVYTSGSRGVVSTAGGYYLPVFVVSLRMLRRTGSTLPVEVFLASHEEYERDICESVLPSLNAQCIILSDILKTAPHSAKVGQYQLKAFAMLFSSFEELLFLDADSFPVHDPRELFTSEPFKSKGLVTWPDFWIMTASDFYYTISAQEKPPVTSRASSEAGEFLLSKRSHQYSLMLAVYYNYFGPSHYYPLLSQGALGEGDKETFLAAAGALGEPYYATRENVRPIGNIQGEEGETVGSAMVQFDPSEEYRLADKGLGHTDDHTIGARPRPFFIHANYPKFNPSSVFDEDRPTRWTNGSDQRAWTSAPGLLDDFGFDVERRFWEEIKGTGCELEGKFRAWKNKVNICANLTRYWHSIFET
ncbi:hypothetical protein MMC20_004300 [Loxospora ochrophaea]|nr:hypothetical protein [Loxospora ochrophaea]